VEFLANLFVVIIIDIHQLNLGPFGSLNYLVKNSLKLCVFFSFISTIKEKYFMYLKKKSIPNERKKIFYDWALNYFFKFLLFGNVL
jgi:hypothetical protein